MDAISLVMPAATIANPGSSSGDAGALDPRGEAAAADFATLLAAGLLPQQDMSALLPGALLPAQAIEEAAQGEQPEALMETDALPLTGTASPLHPDVMAHLRMAAQDGAGDTGSETAQALLPGGEAKREPATLVAAGAASLAADAAGAANAAGSAERVAALELQSMPEASQAAAAEPSALAAHPLHSAAAEKLPAAQPTSCAAMRFPSMCR